MTKKEYLENLDKTVKTLEKFDLNKIDTNVSELKKAFNIAYNNDIFALYNFTKEEQDILKLKLFSKLTPLSGSLSFLAIQILAANSIMNKNDFALKNKYFNKKCGIAINHLRAKKTYVKAVKCEGGYKLDGVLTWASGYKIFNSLLIGFHFNNNEYEVLAKFKEDEGFEILDTPKTFVGQSLNTVNVKLNGFFVKDKDIVSSNKIGNYTKNKSLSKTIHYTIYGLAKGAIKQIANKQLKEISKRRLKEAKTSFLRSNDTEELDFLRVELFQTVQDLITTAMISHGGKSILLQKNLQRYYRELIMFNSNGLNQTIKDLFIIKNMSN